MIWSVMAGFHHRPSGHTNKIRGYGELSI